MKYKINELNFAGQRMLFHSDSEFDTAEWFVSRGLLAHPMMVDGGYMLLVEDKHIQFAQLEKWIAEHLAASNL